MTIANYSALLTQVADWTKRDDMTSRIPLFVSMGESQMNSRLRLRVMEYSESVSLTAGNNYADLPTRFLEPISFYYSDNGEIFQASRDLIDAKRAELSASAGRPGYYAFGAWKVDFERAADQNYTLALRYFRKLDLATDLTNDVLTAAPFAYLYGALMAYARWVEDAEQLNQYAALFQSEMKALEDRDSQSRGSAMLRTEIAETLNGVGFDMTTG